MTCACVCYSHGGKSEATWTHTAAGTGGPHGATDVRLAGCGFKSCWG